MNNPTSARIAPEYKSFAAIRAAAAARDMQAQARHDAQDLIMCLALVAIIILLPIGMWFS